MKNNRDLLGAYISWIYFLIVILSALIDGWYGVIRGIFIPPAILLAVCIIIEAGKKTDIIVEWLDKELKELQFGIKWFNFD